MGVRTDGFVVARGSASDVAQDWDIGGRVGGGGGGGVTGYSIPSDPFLSQTLGEDSTAGSKNACWETVDALVRADSGGLYSIHKEEGPPRN